MSVPVKIKGVKVTKDGALVTSPSEYDIPFYHEMNVDDQVYNFVLPLAHKQFVFTGFLAVSNKDVQADAVIEIYSANSPTSSDAIGAPVKFALTKNQEVSPTPLRILVKNGVWINAKTTDATIHLTMFGNFIDQIE